MHRLTYIDFKKIRFLNLFDMLLLLLVCWWRNLIGIRCNDPMCDTYVLNYILILCNHMMYLCKYLIS
jgi:hypothetical protein